MTIGELVASLQKLPQNENILLLSDFEAFATYPDFKIIKSTIVGAYIIHPEGDFNNNPYL